MWSALAQLIPLGLAAALSSVPLTATILILLSEQRRRSAVPFLLGWVLGMSAVVLVATLVVGVLPAPHLRTSPTVVGIAGIVVGAALLAYGVVAAVRSARAARAGRPAAPSRWLRAVSSLGPRASLGLAVALNLRPKGLLIAVAAGVAVTGSASSDGVLDWGDTLTLLGCFVALAVSTVVVPIVITMASPARMEPRLVRVRSWLERHGGMVTAVVTGLVGLLMVVAGVGALGGR